MPNYGLQPGILMHKGERMTKLESTLDMNHLMTLQAPQEATQLGTIEYWAQKRRSEIPWLRIDGLGGNANISIEGKWAEYDTPAKRDGSTRIVQDLSPDVDAGRGRTEVQMEITGRFMSIGEAFKFDERLKDEFRITRTPVDAGENQIITYVRMDSDEPINKSFIVTGNHLMTMGVNFVSSEFNQDFADWRIDASTGPKYRIPVGQVEIGVKYQVTKDVAQMEFGKNQFQITGADKKMWDDAMEYYFELPNEATVNSQGGTIQTLSEARAIPANASIISDAMKSSKVSVSISSLYDSISVKYLNRGEQQYQLWGSGGQPFNQGGMDEMLAPVGIWQQLDTGYKTVFNIQNFGLHTLEAMYQEYMFGKWDDVQDGSEPILTVQTGRGGFQMVQKMIQEQANNQSIIVTAKDFGSITGAGPYNLSYSPLTYSEIRVPMLAIFRFVYNPGFDSVAYNTVSNPTIQGTGYRLSSFSMIISPENALGSGNIKILRTGDDGGKIFMNIVNGRGVGHPLASTRINMNGITVTQSADLKTGYAAYFTKKLDSAWVMDPTKVLKAVPIDPYSGLTW